MNDPDPIVWKPKRPENTQMWQFMRFVETAHHLKLLDYETLHQWSINQSALFWQALCDFYCIDFKEAPKKILAHEDDMLKARWFEGAQFNFAEKLLSRRDEHPALISIHESGHREVLSYQQLYKEVSDCALGLKAAGVVSGDRIAAIMPNIPQTIIAMLATASLGAIWSSCSPDFGAEAAIDRLGQIEPKILFASDGHQYMGKIHDGLSKLMAMLHAIPTIKHLVIVPHIAQKPEIKKISKAQLWGDFIQSSASCEFVPHPFSHPLYILFSSGTTGKPKCIVHSAGGTLLQHIKELGLHCDIRADDNLLFYTTCGWMMWNWMVSVLSINATLTLYEGASTYPNQSRLLNLLSEEKVSVFGTSAKFISSLDKANVRIDNTSLSRLRCILSTGSPLLPKNYDYVYQYIKKDVQLASISGGTDIVSCFALGNPILPVYRGEIQCKGLGMAVAVFNEEGESIVSEQGELVCTKPFPAMPLGFWNDPDKVAYKKAYFERFPNTWAQGDFAEITPHQGIIIYGRSDAVLNPGGIRIGTAEIYRQIEQFPEIVDSVVIGQNWNDDVRIVLFVKLQAGLTLDDALRAAICNCLKTHASPRHVPAKIIQVQDVPKTISGKIVEIAVRQVVHGQAVANLGSLANPEALDYFRDREELK